MNPWTRGAITPKKMLFIDGIATQKGMVKALEDRLRIKVTVPHDCEYVCAIGAALLGLKHLEERADN